MEWAIIAVASVFGMGMILAATLQIIRMGLAHEEKRMALKAGEGEAGRLIHMLAAHEADMAKLRQRVEVLERLATDGDRKLAGEIDRLRTEQRV